MYYKMHQTFHIEEIRSMYCNILCVLHVVAIIAVNNVVVAVQITKYNSILNIL